MLRHLVRKSIVVTKVFYNIVQSERVGSKVGCTCTLIIIHIDDCCGIYYNQLQIIIICNRQSPFKISKNLQIFLMITCDAGVLYITVSTTSLISTSKLPNLSPKDAFKTQCTIRCYGVSRSYAWACCCQTKWAQNGVVTSGSAARRFSNDLLPTSL